MKSTEVLDKLKELRNLSNETEIKLEKSGLSITNIPKEQLFNHNIKNTINAIEALLRNEPAERHTIRLQREFPDSYINIDKIKQTPSGKLHAENLDRIRGIIQLIEKNYQKI